MTIGRRIWLLAAQFTLAATIVGLVNHWNLSRMAQAITTLGKIDIVVVRELALMDMYHDGLAAKVYKAQIGSLASDFVKVAAVKQEAMEMEKLMSQSLASIESLELAAKDKAILAEVRASIERYSKAVNSILVSFTQGGQKTSAEIFGEFEASFKDVEDKLESVGESLEHMANGDVENALSLTSIAQKTEIAVALAGIFAGLAASLIYVRGISNHLTRVVESFSNASGRLDDVSRQIRHSSLTLSESTAEHSAAIEEAVASMEEMGAMISQTNQNSAHASDDSSRVLDDARQGRNVVKQMVDAMKQIESANDQLQEIVRVIDMIKTKTAVINDIAFETKLLAFNASIEAARAGAHGRGFAVVAEEVGKLAHVSSKAADEVKSLLDDSANKVKSAVSDTRHMIDEGQNTSAQCQVVFNKLESAISSVSNGIQKISAATREQDTGVRQTSKAMVAMERVTQLNLKNAENLASQGGALGQAMEDFQVQTRNLQALVNPRFSRRLVESSRAAESSPAKALSHDPSPLVSARQEAHTASIDIADAQVDRDDNRWNAA